MRVHCAACGELHDIDTLEPSLVRPDAYLQVPREERAVRTEANKDFCIVRAADGSRRWFLRVLLPFSVAGGRTCHWGVWCEVSEAGYKQVALLWDDPDPCNHPPVAASLANDIEGYPSTLNLPGSIGFRDPARLPCFAFSPEVQHPFAEESRQGVTPERVLQWLAPYLHR